MKEAMNLGSYLANQNFFLEWNAPREIIDIPLRFVILFYSFKYSTNLVNLSWGRGKIS